MCSIYNFSIFSNAPPPNAAPACPRAPGTPFPAHLAGQGGDDVLGVHQRRVAQVVEAALLEDLSAGLEPHGLTELHAVLGQQLGGDAAQGAEHRPASVDQLELAVALEGLRVSRQAGGVPAVVAGELASQVGGGGILAVRTCTIPVGIV